MSLSASFERIAHVDVVGFFFLDLLFQLRCAALCVVDSVSLKSSFDLFCLFCAFLRPGPTFCRTGSEFTGLFSFAKKHVGGKHTAATSPIITERTHLSHLRSTPTVMKVI